MTRTEIESLLPFLANETLEGEDRRSVEEAVAADAALQAELDALKAIRTTMQAEEEFSPGEMGLARLMREVEAEPVKIATPTPANKPWIWQSVAAVLLVALVGQTAFQMGGSDDVARGGFELASGDAEAVGPAVAQFRVGFAPDTTEAAMRALLIEGGLVIAGGPNAQGLYDLAVSDAEAFDAARTLLIASDLVETLEDIE